MERAMIRSRGRQRSSPRYQTAAGFASTYRGRAIRREKDKAIASPVRKRERGLPGAFHRKTLRRKPGDGGGDAGGCQGDAEHVQGENHLVETDTFRTNQGNQEYFIEETKYSGDQSGCRQNQRAFYERMRAFFYGHRHIRKTQIQIYFQYIFCRIKTGQN